jgi:cytochrome c-type biogenesis protein CcmH
MMLWLILALMTAAALATAVWPLVRAGRTAATGSDLVVYRDQLEEIERDRTDRRIGADEAEAARVEVSRRLLAAANAESTLPAETGHGGRRRMAAVAAAVVTIPLIAFALYGALGSPDLPWQPLASRTPGGEDPESNPIAQLLARVEARLAENPDDGRGWEVVAPVYMKLERYEEAAKARSHAISLLGPTAIREVDLGEALTAAANGVVSEEAKAAFDRAIALDAANFKAQFYLGLAAEQDGKKDDAIRDYQSLLADSPADVPWRSVVNGRLAALKGEPAPAEGAAAIPEAQRPMIEGMVAKLATRLAGNGGSIDEWSRLIRAYTVLHEADKAKAALADARKALAPDANAVASLDALAHDLGLGDAN